MLCTLAGKTEPAVVVDFAEGGLRLLVRQKAKAGDLIELHYRKGTANQSPVVVAKVAWSRPNGAFFKVGVTCTQEQIFWVPVLMRTLAPTPEANAEKRETVRVRGSLAVTVVANLGLSTDSTLEGELVDLSLGGAAFNTTVPMKLGTPVEISLGRQVTLKAHVIHTRRHGEQTQHGVRFEPMADGTRKKLTKVLQTLRTASPVKAAAKPPAPSRPPNPVLPPNPRSLQTACPGSSTSKSQWGVASRGRPMGMRRNDGGAGLLLQPHHIQKIAEQHQHQECNDCADGQFPFLRPGTDPISRFVTVARRPHRMPMMATFPVLGKLGGDA